MRWAICILNLLVAISSAQEFKEGGRFSPYGPASDEIRNIVHRMKNDPDILRELANYPLEETYETLEEVAGFGNVSDPDARLLAPVAEDILFNHPDFENFMQRTLRKMVKLSNRDGKMPITPEGAMDYEAAVARKPVPRTPEGELEYQISERLWLRTLGTVQVHPSAEMRIRLLGPCLEYSEYWYETGDEFVLGPANHVAGILARAVKKVTGEVIPYTKNGYSFDVGIARQWWRRNEVKYKWTPPGEQPAATPQVPQPTPLPKRIPLKPNRTTDGNKVGENNDSTTSVLANATADDRSSTLYWVIGGALVLTAVAAVKQTLKK